MNKLLPVIIILTLVGDNFSFFKMQRKNKSNGDENKKDTAVIANTSYGGYESQVKYGEHLVLIAGCNDCHTPKKMTPTGPEADLSLLLSGHPEKCHHRM